MYTLPAFLTLILSLCFWQGMRGTDDLGYSQTAVSLLPGMHFSSPHPPTYHDARIGITFPLAGAFFVFGIRDFSLSLLPFLSTVLTGPLVAWLAYHFWGRATGLTAGLLYALFPLTINLSGVCVPEPILIFEICLASVLVLSAIDGHGRSARYKEFLAGVLIGLGYLTTEVGALMIPVFLLCFFVRRKVRLRDGWLPAGFLLVLCIELSYQGIVHGNPLYHFTLSGGLPNDPAVLGANSDLAYRLLKSYPRMFIYPNIDFGILGPLLILGGLYGLIRLRHSSFFVIWSAVILLFYNFMSASLKHYLALPTAPRLIAPACVPLLILSAKLVVDLWNQATSRVSATYVMLLAGAGALCLIIASLLFMYLNTTPDFTAMIARNAKATEELLRKEPSVIVVSDPRSAEAIQFYRQFNPADSYFGFEVASRLLHSQTGNVVRKPFFVVLSGPVIYEKEIKGRVYGGSLTLPARDRNVLPLFLSDSSAQVSSTGFRVASFLKTLLRYPSLRGVLGASGAELAQVLVMGDPRLSQVQVVRFDGKPR